MDFFSLIEKRKSVRSFSEKIVEQDKVAKLLEAAKLAPTSKGQKPLSFKVITDPSLLVKLSEAKEFGSNFLKDAPLAILVCADESISDVWVEDASIASTYLWLASEALDLGSCWVQIRKRKPKTGKTLKHM